MLFTLTPAPAGERRHQYAVDQHITEGGARDHVGANRLVTFELRSGDQHRCRPDDSKQDLKYREVEGFHIDYSL